MFAKLLEWQLCCSARRLNEADRVEHLLVSGILLTKATICQRRHGYHCHSTSL